MEKMGDEVGLERISLIQFKEMMKHLLEKNTKKIEKALAEIIDWKFGSRDSFEEAEEEVVPPTNEKVEILIETETISPMNNKKYENENMKEKHGGIAESTELERKKQGERKWKFYSKKEALKPSGRKKKKKPFSRVTSQFLRRQKQRPDGDICAFCLFFFERQRNYKYRKIFQK